MGESFVIKNDSGSPQNIPDMGIYGIPDGTTLELVDYGKAVTSPDLNALLAAGTVKRVIVGVEIIVAGCCNAVLIKEAVSEGDSAHSSPSWQDKVSLQIPNATSEDIYIEWYFEYKNDSKDQLTEVRVWDGAAELGRECYAFTDKDKGNYKSASGKKKVSVSALTTFKIQSQTAGGTITIRRARLFAWRV